MSDFFEYLFFFVAGFIIGLSVASTILAHRYDDVKFKSTPKVIIEEVPEPEHEDAPIPPVKHVR